MIIPITTITLAIIGLGFVIAWAVLGGGRTYLVLLGLGFGAAAAYFAIPAERGLSGGNQTARYLVVALCFVLFGLAFASATVVFRRRVAQMREEAAAREQAFLEILQATEAKKAAEAEQSGEKATESASEGSSAQCKF